MVTRATIELLADVLICLDRMGRVPATNRLFGSVRIFLPYGSVLARLKTRFDVN